MKKIEVAILNEAHQEPVGMMMFLAKLTQRGHGVKSMKDLMNLYGTSISTGYKRASEIARLPHGTIKRFAPITIAIVGASRRFLAQARTHQVGLDYVSASLQYSDYSNAADFTIPYELLNNIKARNEYLHTCDYAMRNYKYLVDMGVSNDTAGYAAPQGLRNVLIIQGNHQAWDYFIRLRSCNRNTVETQYVATLIWKELLKSNNGEAMFSNAGPDCMFGKCREGNMCCGNPLTPTNPTKMIKEKWPLLEVEDDYNT